MFKPRPKARLKIGQSLLGKKISATVQGYVIYKEFDKTDHVHYYWEEWEITGLNDYDSWIEYDHYTKKVTLYEPIDVGAKLDPQLLTAGQTIDTTVGGKNAQLRVKEVGLATVARREGTLTYHVFENEAMAYAEITGPTGTISVEKYNEVEFDVYQGTRLSKTQQKIVLGRVVEPSWIMKNPSSALWLIFGLPFFVFVMIAQYIPRYETYCTPRSAVSTSTSSTSSKDQLVSEDATRSCYKRRIYGGGSGGVGK